MKKKDIEKLIFAALAIVAALVMIFVTIAICAPPKRSTKAEKVDLSCVTEPGKNPLKDCKQSKKYALKCSTQYVKLPKEKCQIEEQK
jgi:hypothetical protein